MTKPEQLRLAAEITEQNALWQSRANASYEWGGFISDDFPALIACLRQGVEIRIKPEPKTVPLGPEDIEPGSALRYKLACAPERFWMITSVSSDAINVYSRTGLAEIGWDRALAEMEIKRPGQDWQPCSKQVTE